MPPENWDTTSCVHPLHYLPSERRVAPCPPKACSADLSSLYIRSYRPYVIIAVYNRHAAASESLLLWEPPLISLERRIVCMFHDTTFHELRYAKYHNTRTWHLVMDPAFNRILQYYTACVIFNYMISQRYILMRSETKMTWVSILLVYFQINFTYPFLIFRVI